jgi:hypothetical protein
MTIASQGHFVAVPEFTDGTAAATALPDGTVRPYTGLPPDGESVVSTWQLCDGPVFNPHSLFFAVAVAVAGAQTDDKSNAAKAFRRRQLETRMADISRALSFLDTLPDRVRQARRTQGKAAAAGEDDDDDDDEQWIAGARIRCVALVGSRCAHPRLTLLPSGVTGSHKTLTPCSLKSPGGRRVRACFTPRSRRARRWPTTTSLWSATPSVAGKPRDREVTKRMHT